MNKDAITADVAADLVAEQFPQWADLPVVPVALNGWDNTTFRLGGTLSVRLPSHDRYVPQVEKEQRWLPSLAPLLPLPIPEPVALGRPSDIFPRPWSIYRWIEGLPALADDVNDFATFANDLARFLSALYSVDASQGPEPGNHSFFRGGPLDPYDAQSRSRSPSSPMRSTLALRREPGKLHSPARGIGPRCGFMATLLRRTCW